LQFSDILRKGAVLVLKAATDRRPTKGGSGGIQQVYNFVIFSCRKTFKPSKIFVRNKHVR
jgi:hypothetical protein